MDTRVNSSHDLDATRPIPATRSPADAEARVKSLTRVLRSLAGLVILFASLTGAARAVDLSKAVILVASESLAGSPFEQAVILAAPLPDGGHLGIIVNRPTDVKLDSLFPEQASAHNVIDPVYVGGPMLSSMLIAVTGKPPDDNSACIPLTPGLVAVLDGASVDRIIETTPNDARYFLGLTIWPPDALEEQIRSGAWTAQPANEDSAAPPDAARRLKSVGGDWV